MAIRLLVHYHIALNLISTYWFDYTSKIIPHHIISTNLSDMPAYFSENPACYDKQFVRDWLMEHKLNGVTPAPELPEKIMNVTADIYKECYHKITVQQ